MSLQTRIELLVQRLAAEFKSIHGQIGSLANLSVTDKQNLVAAINELHGQLGSAILDDANLSATDKTLSAQKIVQLLDALKAELLGGADAAFDTLQELQQAILTDHTGLANLLTAVNQRVRVDAPQNLSADAQTQACQNIGAVSVTTLGDVDIDLSAVFEQALQDQPNS